MKQHTKKIISPWTVMTVAGLMYIIKWAAKIIVGGWVNSPAIIADAYHNLADMIEVGLVMFFGIYLGNKPKSEEYPMGRKRIESLMVLGIGGVLTIVTLDTIRKSVSGLISLWPWFDEIVRPVLPAFILPPVEGALITPAAFIAVVATVGISAIMSMAVGRYEIFGGKKAGMPSLIADGKETISDGWIEIASFGGFMAKFSLLYTLGNQFPIAVYIVGSLIEYGLGIMVAVIVARTAIELLGNAFAVLLARSIGTEHVDAIRRLALRVQGVRKVKKLVTFSDGHTATCIITIETSTSSEAHRPMRRALRHSISQYLQQHDFLGQEVHVEMSRPEPVFIREAQAIVANGDGSEMNAITLLDATHLRIYDMNADHVRTRAVDVPIAGMTLDEIVQKLYSKGVSKAWVFLGTDAERSALLRMGIGYELNTLLRPYIPSRVVSPNI